MSEDALNALVVIDYQNIHLTAHERFAPVGLPKHETLVHPLHFANQVLITRTHRLAVRAMAEGAPAPMPVRLDRVKVYRGSPSNAQAPTAYRRSQAQRSEWTRDRRVEVYYRTLRYLWDPTRHQKVPSEKGIDVLAALAVVRAADSRAFDLIIVASHDTDLEPAIEAAILGPEVLVPSASDHDGLPGSDVDPPRSVAVETAGWDGCKRLSVPGLEIRNTSLGPGEFVRSRDRRDYT